MPIAKTSLPPTRRALVEALAGLGLSIVSYISSRANAQSMHGTSDQNGSPVHRVAPWLTFPPTPTLPQPTRSELVKLNDASIFFAQFGKGPPVLLLHGGLANSNYWGHQITHLANDFTVIAMDTRGHGRSPLLSRALSYSLFAKDAVGLLDHLNVAQVSIVGWSDGAITGLQLAVSAPERVSRLFAFGANSSPDGLKPSGANSRAFASYAARRRAEYGELSQHPERWTQLVDGLRLMWRREPNFTTHDLQTVRSPTIISDGEFDEIIKRNHTERLASAIPGARLVIQPAVSHFAMLQNPSQFNMVLRTFFQHRFSLSQCGTY
jgi:pimeloyl-ACP methyl ester carboxylesterase